MITENRIEKALVKVAGLASVDPAFLPVFEKLEREFENIRATSEAMNRARQLACVGPVLTAYSAIGASSPAA